MRKVKVSLSKSFAAQVSSTSELTQIIGGEGIKQEKAALLDLSWKFLL